MNENPMRAKFSTSAARLGMHARSTPRLALLGLALAVASLLAARPALAHAVVYPQTSTAGAYEKYVLRVPNEKGVPTTRIEIRFPSEVRVVSFADVPGWRLQVVTDKAGRVTGAVWTGTLAPQRFVELPFVAVNPKSSATLVWPAFQTYSDGDRVEWTGAENARNPASYTRIGGAATTGPSGGVATFVMSVAGLALGMLSLGLVLRREPAAASVTGERPALR
jgi:uncharacterized protein YcnI